MRCHDILIENSKKKRTHSTRLFKVPRVIDVWQFFFWFLNFDFCKKKIPPPRTVNIKGASEWVLGSFETRQVRVCVCVGVGVGVSVSVDVGVVVCVGVGVGVGVGVCVGGCV